MLYAHHSSHVGQTPHPPPLPPPPIPRLPNIYRLTFDNGERRRGEGICLVVLSKVKEDELLAGESRTDIFRLFTWQGIKGGREQLYLKLQKQN